MSIFFTPDDQPCCRFCGQPLPGYAESGHCPHCGKWFSSDRAVIGPSRTRAIALLARSAPAVFGRLPSIWTGVAAAIFITINAAVVILLGRMAVRALYHSCGMTW
jgi:hypothetical protein